MNRSGAASLATSNASSAILEFPALGTQTQDRKIESKNVNKDCCSFWLLSSFVLFPLTISHNHFLAQGFALMTRPVTMSLVRSVCCLHFCANRRPVERFHYLKWSLKLHWKNNKYLLVRLELKTSNYNSSGLWTFLSQMYLKTSWFPLSIK